MSEFPGDDDDLPLIKLVMLKPRFGGVSFARGDRPLLAESRRSISAFPSELNVRY